MPSVVWNLPPGVEHVVWLTPMPLVEGSFLTIPISLTSLYHLLEVTFSPLRAGIFVLLWKHEVDLKIENEWLEGCLISLSDRGGRIVCAKEIPQGKILGN